MRSLIFSLMLCVQVSASSIAIDYEKYSGRVTVKHIDPSTDFVSVWWPMKYNVAERSDLNQDGLTRFSKYMRQPNSYQMMLATWTRPQGFSGNNLYVGTILEKRILDDFENDYFDGGGAFPRPMDVAGGSGQRPWSGVAVIIDNTWQHTPFSRVPEPSTLLLGALTFVGIVTTRRRKK